MTFKGKVNFMNKIIPGNQIAQIKWKYFLKNKTSKLTQNEKKI